MNGSYAFACSFARSHAQTLGAREEQAPDPGLIERGWEEEEQTERRQISWERYEHAHAASRKTRGVDRADGRCVEGHVAELV